MNCDELEDLDAERYQAACDWEREKSIARQLRQAGRINDRDGRAVAEAEGRYDRATKARNAGG